VSGRHTRLANYALYQTGWFACVLGAAWNRPWAGFLIAAILVGVYLALSCDQRREVRLLLLTSVVGLAVEIVQIASGTYRFTSRTIVDALPPPWLVIMWVQFATTFRFTLRPVIAAPPARLRSSPGNAWVRSRFFRHGSTVCSASRWAGRLCCFSSLSSWAGSCRSTLRLATVRHEGITRRAMLSTRSTREFTTGR
jgi:hypothetical protein